MKVIGFQNAECKNCYKCVRTCQVKAIRVKDEQAQIMEDHCVLCGHCLETCPQNAKTFISDLDRVKEYLRRKIPTVVSIAPAYLGILEYNMPGQVVGALKKLGFAQVRETAEGAAFVTNEYAKLLKAGEMKNMITTCCPSVNDLIEKYYPSLTVYMAPVVSPMIAHGKLIKKEIGENVKVVFLGPCIAKKQEAEGDERTSGYIDAVINFEELEHWLKEENIDIKECESLPMDNPDPKVNRLYPVSSGVISSVLAKRTEDDYDKIFVDGIESCMELFESMEKGEINHCFIEANMCAGGCIKGPAVDKLKVSRFKAQLGIKQKVEYSAPDYPEEIPEISLKKDFYSRVIKETMPTEEEIRSILRKTGKRTKEQELNCGACGYPTCRDKAIAVFQEKAELNMCLPFAFEQAQSMSNLVLSTTPNVILIVDSDMKILEFNQKAEKVFKITRSEALNMYLYELIDTSDFEEVLLTSQSIFNKKVEYEAYNITTLQTLVPTNSHNAVLGIFQDITEEEEKNKQRYKMKIETVEMAQKVIDKQMMVAQEIAGLLGETTAETKVTLTKLRDSILYDDGDE